MTPFVPIDHDWIDVVSAIAYLCLGLGGIASLVTALLYVFKIAPERRKLSADAKHTEAETGQTQVDTTKAIVDMWQSLVKQLESRVTQLEEAVKSKVEENSMLSHRIDDLENEVQDLRTWIIQQGLTPPPRNGKQRNARTQE